MPRALHRVNLARMSRAVSTFSTRSSPRLRKTRLRQVIKNICVAMAATTSTHAQTAQKKRLVTQPMSNSKRSKVKNGDNRVTPRTSAPPLQIAHPPPDHSQPQMTAVSVIILHPHFLLAIKKTPEHVPRKFTAVYKHGNRTTFLHNIQRVHTRLYG